MSSWPSRGSRRSSATSTRAFRWFERAIEERDTLVAFVHIYTRAPGAGADGRSAVPRASRPAQPLGRRAVSPTSQDRALDLLGRPSQPSTSLGTVEGSRDSSRALFLPVHADFLCRHSGACCTSGWPIHVETDRLTALREALGAGRLSFARTGPATSLPSSSPRISRPAPGPCFGRARPAPACSTSATAGSARSSGRSATTICRRPASTSRGVARSNPTGSRCRSPTTARPSPGWRSGLTLASTSSRPRRRSPATSRSKGWMRGRRCRRSSGRGCWRTSTGYRAWERVVVDILTWPRTPEAALAEIAAFTERVRTWTPRDGDLREAVERAGTDGRRSPARDRCGQGMAERRSWPLLRRRPRLGPRASPPCPRRIARHDRRPVGGQGVAAHSRGRSAISWPHTRSGTGAPTTAWD